MAAPRRKKSTFRPGELAPVSGVYRIVHQQHRADHVGILLAGEAFPPCRQCRAAVRFILIRSANHVAGDSDLSGHRPSPTIIR